jgi:hypothetical protein
MALALVELVASAAVVAADNRRFEMGSSLELACH